MQTLTLSDHIEQGTFATIGFFDGVHLGHRFLLNQLKKLTENNGLQTLVVTFKNSPQQFFAPQTEPKLLTTANEKLALLQSVGIENCLLINFDNSLATNTSEQFLTFLHQQFSVKKLLVGYDHHFGSERNFSFADYAKIGAKIGVEVVSCPPFFDENLAISSSKIRQKIENGDLTTANKWLGSNYLLSGEVTSGNKIGRKIGFPTANLVVSAEKLVPKNGVYAAKISMESGIFSGMLNIGERPTVSGKNRTIEVHIFDFSGDLYGKKLTLQLTKRLRDEQFFNSLEELKMQLEKDKKSLMKSEATTHKKVRC